MHELSLYVSRIAERLVGLQRKSTHKERVGEKVNSMQVHAIHLPANTCA